VLARRQVSSRFIKADKPLPEKYLPVSFKHLVAGFMEYKD